MLIQDVESYLSVRHAAGFSLRDVGYHLRSLLLIPMPRVTAT